MRLPVSNLQLEIYINELEQIYTNILKKLDPRTTVIRYADVTTKITQILNTTVKLNILQTF